MAVKISGKLACRLTAVAEADESRSGVCGGGEGSHLVRCRIISEIAPVCSALACPLTCATCVFTLGHAGEVEEGSEPMGEKNCGRAGMPEPACEGAIGRVGCGGAAGVAPIPRPAEGRAGVGPTGEAISVILLRPPFLGSNWTHALERPPKRMLSTGKSKIGSRGLRKLAPVCPELVATRVGI